MRKNFFFVAIATLVICSCGSSKQTNTPSRSIATGPEAKVKEWQADGYKIDGTRTMYDKLVAHYQQQDANSNLIEVEGSGIGVEKTDARMYSLNSAAIQYATAASSVVSGGMSREFSNFTELGNKLMGAYTQKIQNAILPFLKESIAVYRNTKKDGKDVIEYDIYYLVDETKVAQVRKDAMDQALKETATEQIFGTAVDEWVKKFVKPMEQ